MEKFAPSHVGKGGFAQAMRLGGFIGVAGGFLYFYQRSIRTFTLPPPSADITQFGWKLHLVAAKGFTGHKRLVDYDMLTLVQSASTA